MYCMYFETLDSIILLHRKIKYDLQYWNLQPLISHKSQPPPPKISALVYWYSCVSVLMHTSLDHVVFPWQTCKSGEKKEILLHNPRKYNFFWWDWIGPLVMTVSIFVSLYSVMTSDNGCNKLVTPISCESCTGHSCFLWTRHRGLLICTTCISILYNLIFTRMRISIRGILVNNLLLNKSMWWVST